MTTTTFSNLTRIAELSDTSLIRPWEDWSSKRRRYDRDGSLKPNAGPMEYSDTYSHWDTIQDTDQLTPDVYVLIDRASGSDYSGNLVEVSNHKVITELCEACDWEDGRQYITYGGGHGTFAIAVNLHAWAESYDAENGFARELLETVEALDDYPLADESLLSELEHEAENEAWESWARADFKRELARYCKAHAEEKYPLIAEFLDYDDGDFITDENAGDWFWRLADLANVYWVNEQGSDSYIDVEDVVTRGMKKLSDVRAEIVDVLRSAATAAILSGEVA